MLWAACELHVRPWHYARLSAGKRELLRLMYAAREKYCTGDGGDFYGNTAGEQLKY